MGYAVGWCGRWIGYGVPAICDYPDCTTRIDRGMSYRCDNFSEGCEFYLCGNHRLHDTTHDTLAEKPDLPEWIHHMLSDESWEQWRNENPATVEEMRKDPLQKVLRYTDYLGTLGVDAVLQDRIDTLRRQLYEMSPVWT